MFKPKHTCSFLNLCLWERKNGSKSSQKKFSQRGWPLIFITQIPKMARSFLKKQLHYSVIFDYLLFLKWDWGGGTFKIGNRKRIISQNYVIICMYLVLHSFYSNADYSTQKLHMLPFGSIGLNSSYSFYLNDKLFIYRSFVYIAEINDFSYALSPHIPTISLYQHPCTTVVHLL